MLFRSGQFGDDNGLVVRLFESDPAAQAAVAVVVFAHIHDAAPRKIRVEREILVFQAGDLGLQEFAEVVRHDFGGHADRNPLGAHHQQQRNPGRQALLLGDKVLVELSPYDLTKGRITWRNK